MIATAVVALAFAAPASSAPSDPGAALEAAIVLYREARFDEAVLALRAVVRRLEPESADPEKRRRMADGYLFLGLAYLGLNDTTAARHAFQELHRLDPERELDPEVYAPKVVELFAAATRERPPDVAATPVPSPTAAATRAPGRRLPWPVFGAGAAAAAGGVVVLAWGGDASPGGVAATLTLNNLAAGAFSCRGGMSFRIGASNPTSRTVRVQRFNLSFSSSSRGCVSHAAPVFGDSMEVYELPPRALDVALRHVDLAADLCVPPNGNPDGCVWQANVVVQTSEGNFSRDLQFVTVP